MWNSAGIYTFVSQMKHVYKQAQIPNETILSSVKLQVQIHIFTLL